MLVGPKRVLFMDEISTGLDSSTTYQVCRESRSNAGRMREDDIVHHGRATFLLQVPVLHQVPVRRHDIAYLKSRRRQFSV